MEDFPLNVFHRIPWSINQGPAGSPISVATLYEPTSLSLNLGLKINRQYYQDVLLMLELLPVICCIAEVVIV